MEQRFAKVTKIYYFCNTQTTNKIIMSADKSYDQLISHGIRPSLQRLAIMEYLINHRTHPNVDEIYESLCPEIPTLSRTTVYNTLKLFYEKHAILALTIDGKCLHYDADTNPHAHFQCTTCGKVFDMPSPLVGANSITPGFKVTDTQVFYWGECPECIENKKKDPDFIKLYQNSIKMS